MTPEEKPKEKGPSDYMDQALKIWKLMERIQNDDEDKPKPQVEEEDDDETPKTVDIDEVVQNKILPKRDGRDFYKYDTVEISDNRRPIYGVLTEPLRGNMKSKNNLFDYIKDEVSYIPKAHV